MELYKKESISVSKTFKTRRRLRRTSTNPKYSFLFREIIDDDYNRNVHWRKHAPYGAKINIHNFKGSYDCWAENAFVTGMNDKDFFCNINIKINKKSQRKTLTDKLVDDALNEECNAA